MLLPSPVRLSSDVSYIRYRVPVNLVSKARGRRLRVPICDDFAPVTTKTQRWSHRRLRQVEG